MTTVNKALQLLLLLILSVIPAFKPSASHLFFPPLPPFPAAPAPPPSCFVPLLPMSACVFFLTNTSGVSAPTPDCCDALESILADDSDIICLCHVMDDNINEYTIVANPINVTLALHLPAACGAALPTRATHMCSLERLPPMNPGGPDRRSSRKRKYKDEVPLKQDELDVTVGAAAKKKRERHQHADGEKKP